VSRTEINVALYKYADYLTHNTDPVFDEEHGPGYRAPRSGIYRCKGCGREAACNENDPLPPQNHHQHDLSQGSIKWQLIVYADHRAK
jgi:hypothetical protein